MAVYRTGVQNRKIVEGKSERCQSEIEPAGHTKANGMSQVRYLATQNNDDAKVAQEPWAHEEPRYP